ncbi:MAG TPA: Lrp/AsnC family transcriptional regulator [Orrella sp.]
MSTYEQKLQNHLDALDQSILKVLQDDADLTNAKLGELVNASAATCQRRVSRLKDIGVIRKEVALLDPSLIGQPLMAICEITLISQADEALSAFEHLLSEASRVQQCYRVSAGPDFVLMLVLTDMADYQTFAGTYLTARHGVRNVKTYFVSRRSKFETAYPMP